MISINSVLSLLFICGLIAAPSLSNAADNVLAGEFEFKICNGLASSECSSTPLFSFSPGDAPYEYMADLPDPERPGQTLRVELHWIKVADTNQTQPALWEPGPKCLTLFGSKEPFPWHWELHSDGYDYYQYEAANDECRPMRRIGALEGIDTVYVKTEMLNGQTRYSIRITPRADTDGKRKAELTGSMQASKVIEAGKSPGRFGEKLLMESGFRNLADVYLVTGYGIFKGTERSVATGGGGFTVISVTDLYHAFRPGDLFFKAGQDSGNPLGLRLTGRERTGDGTRCPDTDGVERPYAMRLVMLKRGNRTWMVERVTPAQSERYCVVQVVNLRTCRVIDCKQWSDTLSSDPNDGVMFLTEHENHAHQLYASLPTLTLASTGTAYDTATWRGTVRERDSSGWDSCGPEGCEAQRRREQIEEFLIDLWNR